MCVYQENQTILGLSPDLLRDEKVSFVGKLKHPLIFRDVMLMLREIVISDLRQKKKEREDFFRWLNQEIDRKTLEHLKGVPDIQEKLKEQIKENRNKFTNIMQEISELTLEQHELRNKLSKGDYWKDFYTLQHEFDIFLQKRDPSLYRALDPVISVHPDQVSFEAFSLDESIYGCLSVKMNEFDIIGTPKLGTTNIDFSNKLAEEIERFRTYTNVELSINPEGFTVESDIKPEYLEKKIDLPESWIKGFNQVSAAASLDGIFIDLPKVDMYDICSFLRRNKAHKSPRYMKWIFEPDKRIRIIFEPWGKELVLTAVFNGKQPREEKIWGRRRWLIIEKIIPLAKSFKLKLLGFGMPQFIIADLGGINITIGFTSWSSNDWVKGTAFNIMAGFIGEGDDAIYSLLKKKRTLSLEQLNETIKKNTREENKAGIGILLRKGEAYFDVVNKIYRFRQLLNIPLPEELYKATEMEKDVLKLLQQSEDSLKIKVNSNGEINAKISYNIPDPKYNTRRYYYNNYYKKHSDSKTEITHDVDKQIIALKCNCKKFKKGPRNISAPCSHILSLYIKISEILELPLLPNKTYDFKELEELKAND